MQAPHPKVGVSGNNIKQRQRTNRAVAIPKGGVLFAVEKAAVSKYSTL